MEDDNSMPERILRKLASHFDDSELKEFAVIPSGVNLKNESPILYEEHHIGLKSWCVKHIYRYAYLELFEWRRLLAKKKLPFSKERDLNHLLIGVLLINPDVSTFWNMKRELVQNDVVSVQKELDFARIVLTYKSKSNEAFAYRRWLLNRVLSKLPQSDTHTPQILLEDELRVTEMAASKNSNNYHAWTHRIWCIELMEQRIANFGNFLMAELEFSQQWIYEHVSEHTGYHYRQYLINLLKKSRKITTIFYYYFTQVSTDFGLVNDNDDRNFLTFLLGKNKQNSLPIEEANKNVNYLCLLLYDLFHTMEILNSIYRDHESMWYHRRFLVYQLVKTSCEYHDLPLSSNIAVDIAPLNNSSTLFNEGEKQPKLFKVQPNKVESSFLYHSLLKNETKFIKNASGFFNIEFAKRHEKWLQSVLGIEQK